MDKAKIRLSPAEAELVSNPSWILTKNAILNKVRWMLEDLQAKQQEFIVSNPTYLPAPVRSTTPKISRGENYRGLPYLILDHPRHFHPAGIFAIRTMFWWGNFFSITLHLSGEYKAALEDRINELYPQLRETFFICINENEWEHHFDKENYKPLAETTEAGFREITDSREFLKLSRRIPLEEWDVVGDLLLEEFREIIKRLAID